MGVIMQAFYWDCPQIEAKPFQWWKYLHGEVPRLAAAGFTVLWLPPANKAASNTSMGYDPYDYYDLGEFDQTSKAPSPPGLVRKPICWR
jgi:alpha-amylase